MKKEALGKGLSSLIPSDEENESSLEISMIIPGKYQPRTQFDKKEIQELSDSIKQLGIIQPIVVRQIDDKYEIIAGERRFRAAKLANLNEVPVIIKDLTDKEALSIAIIENVQRKDLNPIEEALGYKRLIEEFDYTQEDVSKIIGKSRSHISNSIRILSLPEDVLDKVEKGEISFGHAKSIVKAENPSELANEIVKTKLTVRQTEKISKNESYSDEEIKDDDIAALEQVLSEVLNLDVDIKSQGNYGQIIVNYNNLEELDKIIRKLSE